jgi:hypothetical protein
MLMGNLNASCGISMAGTAIVSFVFDGIDTSRTEGPGVVAGVPDASIFPQLLQI